MRLGWGSGVGVGETAAFLSLLTLSTNLLTRSSMGARHRCLSKHNYSSVMR